jgi:hypothetical protein
MAAVDLRASRQRSGADGDLAYFNQSGVQIGSTNWAALTDPTPAVWTARSLSDTTPAACAIIRLYMEMSRRTGTNNDGYIDDIVLTVGGSTILLHNPGAEQGTVGWTNQAGAIGYNNTNLTPHSGTYYFTGGTSRSAAPIRIMPPTRTAPIRCGAAMARSRSTATTISGSATGPLRSRPQARSAGLPRD